MVRRGGTRPKAARLCADCGHPLGRHERDDFLQYTGACHDTVLTVKGEERIVEMCPCAKAVAPAA
jgi:hypothetical protein